MSSLRPAVGDYLAMRRALGFKLDRAETLLPRFADFIQDRGERHVTVDAAVAWATLPAGSAGWWASRLQIARGFAAFMHAIDPVNEIPAPDLLPRPPHRATPYLYTPEQIDALIAAAGTLRTPHRVATMQTLLGLLAVTGMRISEVVGLDHDDFDTRTGCLLVRDTKFGKSRELALHASTVTAVKRYLRRADRPPHQRAHRRCWSRSSALGWAPRMSSGPSRRSDTAPGSRPAQRPAGRDCMTSATALLSRPCSTPTTPTSMSAAGWRCWPPISATSTQPPPIGICRPLQSSCNSLQTGWRTTPEQAHERPRPDA